MQQLVYFTAVAASGSFTHAADQVGVAQPTLSKQVRVLEAELGTPLFDRTSSGATLTQAGEVLLPYASRILSDAESARVQVQELAGLRRGRLRVGATPSLWSGLVADALRAFRTGHPDLEVQVQESGSKDLVRQLSDGELDLALVIVSQHHHEPALVTTPLLREDLVVVSPADEPPPVPGGVMRITDLAGRPLVMFRPGYDLRDVTLSACRAAGFEPELAIEGGEMDAVLRFAEAGLGLAVVPSMVLATRPLLRATPLVEPRLRRTVALAVRKGIAPPPAATAFRRALMDHLEKLSQEDLGVGVELLPVRVRLDLLGLPPVPASAG
jgi:DNA-binding transcriptional LysR family regulator